MWLIFAEQTKPTLEIVETIFKPQDETQMKHRSANRSVIRGAMPSPLSVFHLCSSVAQSFVRPPRHQPAAAVYVIQHARDDGVHDLFNCGGVCSRRGWQEATLRPRAGAVLT